MRARPRITVHDRQRSVRVNVSALALFAQKALETVWAIRSAQPTALASIEEVAVLLISDRRMASLHRQFLKQGGPTDVITFDHGEIFISTETAQRNARRFRTSLRHELQLYVVHGLLHLHGFDDGTAAEARRMRRMQEKILQTLMR